MARLFCFTISREGVSFMKSIKDVNDFKKFIKMNQEEFYEKIVKADDISINDEWMQEKQWDEYYKEGEKKNGEI